MWANHASRRRSVTRVGPNRVHYPQVGDAARSGRRDGTALSPVLRVSLAGILSTMADAVDESAFESLVDVFECYVAPSTRGLSGTVAGRTREPEDALLGLSAVGAGPIAALRDLQRVAPDSAPGRGAGFGRAAAPAAWRGGGGVEGSAEDGRRTSPTTCRRADRRTGPR